MAYDAEYIGANDFFESNSKSHTPIYLKPFLQVSLCRYLKMPRKIIKFVFKLQTRNKRLHCAETLRVWVHISYVVWELNRLVQITTLTLIGMSYESKKNAHLYGNLGASFIRLNELGRVSNYPDWSQFLPPKMFGNFW